ncbi:hypothetical protein [Gordonia lacunae]|uniref:Serine/threonine protein kinase n=1 Tax=Gordonia lacunae TaxID=417102 RepID=A0A243QC66_9ACTN|nr:hypothetical protein [Gordonia lacunae]OUC79331.1 hypothetical protein CA982_07635 [Gordonia lacunae]
MTFPRSAHLGVGILAFAAAIVTGCSTDTTSDAPVSSIATSPAATSHSAAPSHDSARPATPSQAAPPAAGSDTDDGGSSDDIGTDGQPPAGTPADNVPAAAPPPAATERPVDPNEPPAGGTYCGDGYNGLAVWAFGPDCATAQSVSSALGAKRAGGAHFPITVTVAGSNWICGEGTNPVPYMECSGLGAVRLTS